MTDNSSSARGKKKEGTTAVVTEVYCGNRRGFINDLKDLFEQLLRPQRQKSRKICQPRTIWAVECTVADRLAACADFD
jgi:hypothetical protein